MKIEAGRRTVSGRAARHGTAGGRRLEFGVAPAVPASLSSVLSPAIDDGGPAATPAGAWRGAARGAAWWSPSKPRHCIGWERVARQQGPCPPPPSASDPAKILLQDGAAEQAERTAGRPAFQRGAVHKPRACLAPRGGGLAFTHYGTPPALQTGQCACTLQQCAWLDAHCSYTCTLLQQAIPASHILLKTVCKPSTRLGTECIRKRTARRSVHAATLQRLQRGVCHARTLFGL